MQQENKHRWIGFIAIALVVGVLVELLYSYRSSVGGLLGHMRNKFQPLPADDCELAPMMISVEGLNGSASRGGSANDEDQSSGDYPGSYGGPRLFPSATAAGSSAVAKPPGNANGVVNGRSVGALKQPATATAATAGQRSQPAVGSHAPAMAGNGQAPQQQQQPLFTLEDDA